MNTFVLMIAKKFPMKHNRYPELTNFADKIKAGHKIHTIRGSYDLWAGRIEQIQKNQAILSVREWSGVPYRSPQVELMRLSNVGLQRLGITYGGFQVEGSNKLIKPSELAQNDGLTVFEFNEWFRQTIQINMAVIHFTDFRYGQ